MKWLDWLRRRGNPRRALAFVDYEHWFYSYNNLYKLKPDLPAWRRELEQRYRLEGLYVFGDFTEPVLAESLQDLPQGVCTLVSAQRAGIHHKKDMTDFVMLDAIYQAAARRRGVGTYVLFTGDGNFLPVVQYLRGVRRRRVLLYGVRGGFSRSLKAEADEVCELPPESHVQHVVERLLVENLAYVSQHDEIIPSFWGTVGAVARRGNVGEEIVSQALQQMLDRGLVLRKERIVGFRQKVKVIAPDWDKLIEAGLWDPRTQQPNP